MAARGTAAPSAVWTNGNATLNNASPTRVFVAYRPSRPQFVNQSVNRSRMTSS